MKELFENKTIHFEFLEEIQLVSMFARRVHKLGKT